MPMLSRAASALFACVVGLTISVVPIFSSGTAVLLIPITRETGWSRGQVSWLIAAGLAGIAIAAPLAGRLIDRYGARRVVLVCAIGFPVTLIAFSEAATLGSALCLAFLAGFIGCGVSQYSYLTVLPLYFDRRLGLSLGVAMIGMGMGTMVVPFLVQHLEAGHTWREVYRILAVIVLVLGLANAFFFLRMPRRQKIQQAANPAPSVQSAGMTAGEAVRSRVFSLLAISIFLSVTVMTGFGIHLTALMTDRGFSPARAVAVFSLYGLTQAAARFAGGFLLDYIDARWIGAFCLLGAALGAAFLASGVSGYLVLVSVCLLSTAMGIDGDLLPYMTRRHFGLREYSTIYGLLGLTFSLGPPVGAILMGRSFDLFGGYSPMLWIVASVSIVSALLLLNVGRPTGDFPQRRDRAEGLTQLQQ
jgi:MFS transporter, OFA family, oxalate/formate antiporter